MLVVFGEKQNIELSETWKHVVITRLCSEDDIAILALSHDTAYALLPRRSNLAGANQRTLNWTEQPFSL